ncbi:MAG TPA: hypothetical protein VF173_04960 [Thermoanaerobaculia bacterium]|nr:hypothetical protein [Thermoanaerobaculia bacterium]
MKKKSVKKLTLHLESLRVLDGPSIRQAAGGTETGITLCVLTTCIRPTKTPVFDTE